MDKEQSTKYKEHLYVVNCTLYFSEFVRCKLYLVLLFTLHASHFTFKKHRFYGIRTHIYHSHIR